MIPSTSGARGSHGLLDERLPGQTVPIFWPQPNCIFSDLGRFALQNIFSEIEYF